MARKRAKRSPLPQNDSATTVYPAKRRASLNQRCSTTILDVPIEVMMQIFSYFSYQVIAKDLRSVNTHFRRAGSCALNSGLFSLGRRLEHALASVAMMMQCECEDEVWRLKPVTEAFNFLERLQYQHRLILAVTGRILDPAAGRCVFDGALLDNMHRLVMIALRWGTEPSYRYNFGSCGDISEWTRRFLDHFEKVVGQPADQPGLLVAKALDVLDCGLDVGKQVVRETVAVGPSGTRQLQLSVRYTMPRAYFIALPLTGSQDTGKSGGSNTPDSWDEPRLVFLRLRRLVQHHNEFTLKKLHCDRVHGLCAPSWPTSPYARTPIEPSSALTPSSFVGFGESGGRFFYYGNLNETAFGICTGRPGPRAREGTEPGNEDEAVDLLWNWQFNTAVSEESLEPSRSWIRYRPSSATGLPVASTSASPSTPTSTSASALPEHAVLEEEQHCDTDLKIQVDLICDLELAPPEMQTKYDTFPPTVVLAQDEAGNSSKAGLEAARVGASAGTRAWVKLIRGEAGGADVTKHAKLPLPPSFSLRIAFHSPLAVEDRLPAVAYLRCGSG